MSIHLTRYFGINARRMLDANGQRWIVFVAWYPRARSRLGYLYWSLPTL